MFQTTKGIMKIKTSDAVALLVALGFSKAGDWSEDKLVDKLQVVPDKVAPDSPEIKGHEDIYEALKEAKGNITLVGGTDAKGEEMVDVSDMDMAALRSLVEERKLKVKPAEMKNVEVLRVAVKKALKTAPKQSKTDRAIDKAAKDGKKDKPAAKKGKEEKEAKSDREVDEFGSTIGSIRSNVNKALSEEWQTDQEIAKSAGVTLKQARSRLRRAARKGLIEVQRRIEYRLLDK